jgi:hypothetical protein
MNNTNEAFQLMNFCRKVAVMGQEDWLQQYRSNLSLTDRRKLSTIRYISSSSIICRFPWEPNYAANAQEPTPRIANAVPVVNNPEMQYNAENPARRRRRQRRNSDSEEEYQAPFQRREDLEHVAQDNDSVASTAVEKVQKLLRSFGPKLMYQRHHGQFQTRRYNDYINYQGTDEELFIKKCEIEIKENLAMAYESEVKSVHHHYLVGEKLVMLFERVGRERFKVFLNDDIHMSLK